MSCFWVWIEFLKAPNEGLDYAICGEASKKFIFVGLELGGRRIERQEQVRLTSNLLM